MPESKYSRKLKEKLGGWMFNSIKKAVEILVFWKSAGYIYRKFRKKISRES
ncbi:MAG: hypothetical protein ABEJ72_04585 [Candidatus Aenigmatarchaeota archaeon]